MEFISFLYLLVIGAVVAVVLANLPKIGVKLSCGIIATIIVAYIGARVGNFLFGNWPFLVYEGISILPAMLGAVVAILLAKTCTECCKK